jgi:putative hydrolase of the HAD superfamily
VRYEAIVFDLFGTLVHTVSSQQYRTTLTKMASVLSIDTDAFAQLWADTSGDRIEGVMRNCRENFEHVCRRVGSPISDARIELASKIRLDMIRGEMVPRMDAVEVLSSLKSGGYKVGLISNCTYEATIIWRSTPFAPLTDATVFSCLVGLKKPDARIYQLAIQLLGVRPQDCLYIGDGGSHELTGASQVGMNPVLLSVPAEDISSVYTVESEANDWDGPVISSLTDVLGLL